MSISSFRELKVWQAGIDLTEQVYTLTKQFPKEEMYGLTSQIRRAVVSVPSNIAEGHGRDSTKEFLHFLSIAVGSLFEVETQLIIAQRLGYLDKSNLQPLLFKIEEISKMLKGLQKSLKAKLS